MATPEFVYQDPFPLSKDDTPYCLLSKEHVSLTKFDGKEVLKIEPEALTLLANEAIRDVSFLLRTPHLQNVAQRGYLIQGNSPILPGHGYGYSLRQKGPAAILAKENIKKVEPHEYPELGIEAIWKIEVEDFPAFILVDDKGNDFFRQICA